MKSAKTEQENKDVSYKSILHKNKEKTKEKPQRKKSVGISFSEEPQIEEPFLKSSSKQHIVSESSSTDSDDAQRTVRREKKKRKIRKPETRFVVPDDSRDDTIDTSA